MIRMKKLLWPNEDDYTAIDFAGMHKSFEALIIMIQYFQQNFHILDLVFSVDKKGKPFKCQGETTDNQGKEDEDDLNYPWTITRVNKSELTYTQSLYARLFYWAAFIGELKFCKLFLKKLGVSPFMKIYMNQNVIGASILGCQYQTFKLLVQDSLQEEVYFGNSQDQKYIIDDPKNIEYFNKSRRNKDKGGNNSCHLVFEMSRENIRYKFLDILIDQKIGDINKPNVLGLLPHQMDHFQPLRNLPDHILSHLPATIQEIQEADYVIITPEDKKDIILDELQELKLYYPDDHKKNLVHQFFYEENKIDPVNFLKSRGATKLM